MRKDQKLGVTAFSLFVLLFIELSVWLTYPLGKSPDVLTIIWGPTLALFIGFTIWAYSASCERNRDLKTQN